MLLQIAVERHTVEHHPMADAACIEQMKPPVTAPHGQAQVADIQSVTAGNECQYVAILYARQFTAPLAGQAGGDISHLLSAGLLLTLRHTLGLSLIAAYHRVGAAVMRHIVQVEFLHLGERPTACPHAG